MRSRSVSPATVPKLISRRPVHALCGVLCGLLLGCSGAKSPPKLPLLPAPAVALPAPALPTDPTMFGYLRINDLHGLIQRIGGAQAEQLAKQRDVNLSELTPGAPLVAFLWDPQGATPLEAPVVVLAPITPDSGLSTMLKATSPAVRLAAVGAAKTTTAITLGDAAQERFKTGEKELVALATAKAPFDLTLYLNAVPILAKYGPLMRSGIAAMGPLLEMAAAKNTSAAAPSPKSTMAMFEQMLSGLEELQSLTIGSTVTDTALELSLLTTQKSGAATGPLLVPDLAQFVPPGDLKLQWNTRDLKKLTDWYLRMYGGFLDENLALKAQVNELIADWLKAGRVMETAMSGSFRSGKGLSVYGVMRLEDGAAAMAAVRRSVKLFSTGPVHELYQKMGIDLKINSQQATRKLKGHPVDRYEYSFKLNSQAPTVDPTLKLMFDKMSGLTYEIAQVGPYLVYALGGQVDSVVDALLAGKGAYPLAAMKTFPAGGSLYLELDVAQVVEWFKAVVPASAAVKLPTLPAQGSVISAWSYDGGVHSYQKTVIPTQLIKNIAAAAR